MDNLKINDLRKQLTDRKNASRLGYKEISLHTDLSPYEVYRFLQGKEIDAGKISSIVNYLNETSSHSPNIDMWEVFGEEIEENVEQCPSCFAWASKGLLEHECF